MKLFDVYPLQQITPVKGKGCWVWDEAGKKYLDCYGGHAVISIGHGDEHYVKSIQKQVENLGFYSNSVINPLQIELAKLLGEMSGYPDYQFFMVNNGAEAVENAIRLASFHTSRKKVVSFKGAFHGRTSGSLAVTDNPKIRSSFNADHEVIFVELNNVDEISRIMDNGDIAAIIIEGIQGISGVIAPEDDFLQFIEQTCIRNGSMLILDEIQSGFGRTGKFFAHQYANIKPHLITTAKGMGNGFPVGGVLIHPEIKSSLGMLGTTFGGGHLACAATKAVLEVINRKYLIQNAYEMGHYFQHQLRGIPEVIEIRGRGLMIGITFNFSVSELRENLLKEGILTGNASDPNVLRLLPPLCISKEEIDTVIIKLKIVLKNINSETVSVSS